VIGLNKKENLKAVNIKISRGSVFGEHLRITELNLIHPVQVFIFVKGTSTLTIKIY
jgi:hypothetical protein